MALSLLPLVLFLFLVPTVTDQIRLPKGTGKTVSVSCHPLANAMYLRGRSCMCTLINEFSDNCFVKL